MVRSEEEASVSLLSHYVGSFASNVLRRKDAKEESTVRPSWTAEAEKLQYRAFDMADAMEQGLSRELTTTFITAPADAETVEKLLIEVSDCGREFVLQTRDGEPLLVARAYRAAGRQEAKEEQRPNRIDVFVYTGGDPPLAVGPAFSLAATDAKCTQWEISACRCECCAYLPSRALQVGGQGCCSRDLAYVAQTEEFINGNKIMCMEVCLPELLEDGTPEVWCARAGAPSECSRRRMLKSKLPKWNSRLGSLTQDFYGRCKLASSRNIQLESVGEQSRKRTKYPVFLQGKVGDNLFVLDYKRPLGMAQAFAIALTTQFWQ